jgi:hypothetical protein
MPKANESRRKKPELMDAVLREDSKKDSGKRVFSAKEAANAAAQYATELLGAPHHFSLEEVELSEDGKFWFVTLGMQDVGAPFSPKTYKVFKVNSRTGEVLSMKMRES